MAFFKKVACFTDIHFGLKGNSRIHNDDCEQFVKWFIEHAKAEAVRPVYSSETGTITDLPQTFPQ